MNRPVKKGGWIRLGSIAPAVRFAALRVFLTAEALKGDEAAIRLLREMRGKPGGVNA